MPHLDERRSRHLVSSVWQVLARARTSSCDAALAEACGAKKSDVFACAECAGAHQQTLKAKGCGSDWNQCASIEANPAFAHGGRTVLLSMMDGPNHGKVHALSTADGSERWAVEVGGSLRASTSSPVVAPGVRADRFFVAAGALPFHGGGNVVLGGAVHAFDLPPLPSLAP